MTTDHKAELSRRTFINRTLAAGSLLAASPISSLQASQSGSAAGMRMGLVTYLWGADWDLPTLIRNCELAKYEGVELRTEHAHGVEPSLSAAERREVKRRFADSSIECVGYGSNQEYHSPDPAELRQNIEGTFEFIKLCHDIGATGVKVKPNTLPESVPYERTIEQVGRALNEVGRFASDYGQAIRVEVHGRVTAQIPVMKAIFDHVEEPNVGICWNCNEQDLLPPGLKANFDLVKDDFADTVHVREMDEEGYPYARLFELLVGMDYRGWILLEARGEPEDRVGAMKKQLQAFRQLVEAAQR